MVSREVAGDWQIAASLFAAWRCLACQQAQGGLCIVRRDVCQLHVGNGSALEAVEADPGGDIRNGSCSMVSRLRQEARSLLHLCCAA
jgi:hypothetical protein